MSGAARQVIDSFEALSPAEQREVITELLRQSLEAPYDVSDSELIYAADLTFQILDRHEANG